MNNPALCEVLIEGNRCNGFSSHIYKSAYATRLVCDDCARRYRTEGSTSPILEFALLELVPARELLVDRLTKTEKAFGKLRALVVLQKAQDTRLALIILAMAIPAIVAMIILTKGIVLEALVPLWVGSSVAIHLGKRSTDRKAKVIHDQFGYPELGL